MCGWTKCRQIEKNEILTTNANSHQWAFTMNWLIKDGEKKSQKNMLSFEYLLMILLMHNWSHPIYFLFTASHGVCGGLFTQGPKLVPRINFGRIPTLRRLESANSGPTIHRIIRLLRFRSSPQFCQPLTDSRSARGAVAPLAPLEGQGHNVTISSCSVSLHFFVLGPCARAALDYRQRRKSPFPIISGRVFVVFHPHIKL